MKFQFVGKTDTGNIRQVNEDKFDYFQTEEMLAAIVCDGMGGYNGGAMAASIASDSILNHLKTVKATSSIETEIISAFKVANDIITLKSVENNSYSQMGTTVALLFINQSEFITAHLGDSRVYLIRDKQIIRLTKDHSLIQQIIDEKKLSLEQALKIEDRNVLTRALGINGLSKPEMSEPQKVLLNDIFLICSDGLTNFVSENEILDFLFDNEPEEACEQLIYLANLRGGDDNITAVIIRAVE